MQDELNVPLVQSVTWLFRFGISVPDVGQSLREALAGVLLSASGTLAD
ncbi:hypothetical protein [Streptomyces sp. NPDC048516]